MSHSPRLTLIVAIASNGVIGANNTLPWHLPEDLKHFRRHTLGHTVVMGRKTWDSLGRPLPGRRNVVVSRNADFRCEGADVFGSLEAALAACADEQVFIIGGATLYAQALPLASQLIVTEIATAFPGDTVFPPIDRRVWHETAREAHTSATHLDYAFVTFERTH